MIEEFECDYMNKYWELQMKQWSNYFEDGNYDLSEVDNEIFNIVTKFHSEIKPNHRKSQIASLLIKRNLVDKTPVVAKLRNFIDNQDNYSYGISTQVKSDRYNYKRELALRMKDDVTNLIKIRNELAKDSGFMSYPELVLASEEIDKKRLIDLLNKYLYDNLPKALELIKKYDIKWESWFSDLGRISICENKHQPIELVDQLMTILGLEDIKGKVQISYNNKGFSGVASEVSPRDIRIMLESISSLWKLKILFHEMGHAISYFYNKENGLYKILPASYDEAMAMVMEHIAPKLLLNNDEQERIAEIELLEHTRCSISALYEFELWENPEHAEELYVKYYSKLGFKIEDPFMWASDTFRSIDPVYIHNYVIGAVLGENLTKYFLEKYSLDYKQWGKWLVDNVYVDGTKRMFKEKLREVCDVL